MSLLGIRHVVVAVNKMDLVGYSRDVFERIKDDYTGFVAKLDLPDVTFIPMSALKGDNVVVQERRDAVVLTARRCWTTWRRSTSPATAT